MCSCWLLKKRTKTSLDSVRWFATNEQTLNPLGRDLTAKTSVYIMFMQRYEDAQVARELTRMDESKQIWRVEEPVAPIPERHMPLTLTLIAGPVVGPILVLGRNALLEFLVPTVRREDEATKLTGEPVSGTLPWMGSVGR